MAYEALDSLRGTLNRILKQSHHPDINQQIISIHDDAVILQLQLQLADNPESLKERIREEANTMEDIIEHLFSEDNSIYGEWMQHSKELRKAAEKFKSTAGDVVDSITNKRRRLSDICPSASSSSRTATRSKDVVVGFDEDLEEIKNWLTSYHLSQLQVLSIVGMGGTDQFVIPSQIGDIPTLKLIEVDTHLLEWAKKIEEKQRQSGNDSFQVRTKKRSYYALPTQHTVRTFSAA